MSKNSVLEIEDLNVGYNTYRGFSDVLDDLNLTLKKGEKIGVIGESGCGKTTTMKSIHQILSDNAVIKSGKIYFNGDELFALDRSYEKYLEKGPIHTELQDTFEENDLSVPSKSKLSKEGDSWAVKYKGTVRYGIYQTENGMIVKPRRDVLKMKKKELMSLRRRHVSMIPQDPTASLNPLYKVKTQMKDVLKYSGETTDEIEDYKERSIELFDEVALTDPERVLDSYPFQLSGGMRQRVCIAMSVAVAKDILIADEPTTNLDVTIQDQVLRLIRDILEERDFSAIFVSQALGAVRKFVDRIYVVYGGTVVESASTSRIFTDPKHPYTVGLMESIPKLTGGGFSVGIAGQTPDYVDAPSGCRFHPRCPDAKDKCKEEKPDLVDLGNDHYVACWRD